MTPTQRIIHGLLCLALGLLLVLPILFAPVMRQHRVTGYQCGPERLTFTAAEEDHLPAPCERVEATP